MKEKEIRERIEQFLRKTARNIVVPASVGLGLGVAGCDSHTMSVRAADAGHGDAAVQVSDAAKSPQRDLAATTSDVAPPTPDTGDAAPASDLPLMAIPYIVALPPSDAAPEQAADGASEAGVPGPDATADADVPYPPLIYVFYMGRPTANDTAPPKTTAMPPVPPDKA
jgi:hypothetical protein